MNRMTLYIFVFCMATLGLSFAHSENQKSTFWEKLQSGANIFNHCVTTEDIKAAKNYGISFIRLAPDKFKSAERDFLIGDADNYKGLVQADLKTLKKVLDICVVEKMPVVLTMISLPGSRWKQHNNNNDDLRIWTEAKFQDQAAQFWQDLSRELKDHPAIVGYNLLNEPHPERIYDKSSVHIHEVRQTDVQQKLYEFYKRLFASVRKSDLVTPIILDSSSYGDAQTFKDFKIQDDKNTLYSFHMYEPYAYTNLKTNAGKYSYPGKIENKLCDKVALKAYMNAVCQFQKINNISSNRILVGEFGGHRCSEGLDQYFKDLIAIFRENKWHYAFYAFREDVWDGMDYELGSKKLPWSYWQAIEKGEAPKLNRDPNSPNFRVLCDGLKKQ